MFFPVFPLDRTQRVDLDHCGVDQLVGGHAGGHRAVHVLLMQTESRVNASKYVIQLVGQLKLEQQPIESDKHGLDEAVPDAQLSRHSRQPPSVAGGAG